MSGHVITIEYCTSCNYLPRALWVAGEILADMQFELSRFELVMGTKGVFEVLVDGKLVHSKAASGRFPEPDELKQAIFSHLEGGAA